MHYIVYFHTKKKKMTWTKTLLTGIMATSAIGIYGQNVSPPTSQLPTAPPPPPPMAPPINRLPPLPPLPPLPTSPSTTSSNFKKDDKKKTLKRPFTMPPLLSSGIPCPVEACSLFDWDPVVCTKPCPNHMVKFTFKYCEDLPEEPLPCLAYCKPDTYMAFHFGDGLPNLISSIVQDDFNPDFKNATGYFFLKDAILSNMTLAAYNHFPDHLWGKMSMHFHDLREGITKLELEMPQGKCYGEIRYMTNALTIPVSIHKEELKSKQVKNKLKLIQQVLPDLPSLPGQLETFSYQGAGSEHSQKNLVFSRSELLGSASFATMSLCVSTLSLFVSYIL